MWDLKASGFIWKLLYVVPGFYFSSDSSYTDPNSAIGQPGSHRKAGRSYSWHSLGKTSYPWCLCPFILPLRINSHSNFLLLSATWCFIFISRIISFWTMAVSKFRLKQNQISSCSGPDQATTVHPAVGVSRCRPALHCTPSVTLRLCCAA